MFKLKEFSISSSMKSIKMIVYFGKQGLGCLTFAWTPQQPWALSSCCPHLSAAEKLELEGETLEEPVGQLQLSACSCRPDKAAAGHPGLVAAHTGQGQYHWTHDSKQGYMQWTLAYRVKRCIVQHVNYWLWWEHIQNNAINSNVFLSKMSFGYLKQKDNWKRTKGFHHYNDHRIKFKTDVELL